MKKTISSVLLGCAAGLLMGITPVLAEETDQPLNNEAEPTEVQESEQPTLEVAEETEPVVAEPVVTEPKNGLVEEEGSTYYYIDDVRQNGQKKIDGYWYMFDQQTGQMKTGFVDIPYQNKTVYYDENGHMLYGFQQIEDNWYWLNTGSGKREFTGVVQNSQDGQWYFVRNGIGEQFTGWSKSILNNRWYFTQDGILNWSFTGVAKSVANNKWYHGKDGRLDWNFTGWSKSIANDQWYFSRKGALDWGFTGVAKSVTNNRWYHGKDGKLDWGFTGFSKSVLNAKWYFSRNGRLDWDFTGLGKSIFNNQWYHAKKGELDWNFTGVSRSVLTQLLYYSKKGKLDWNYTGMGRSVEDGEDYYCIKGRVQHNTSGFIYNPGDRYHYFLENGKKVKKTGLQVMNGKTYLFYKENSGVAVDSFEYLKKYGKRQISYFNGSGHMMTGKFHAQGHWFQANNSGAINDKTVNRLMWCLDLAENDYHGYSLYRRTSGRDYDCSSMVYYSLIHNGYSAAQIGLNYPFTTFIMDEHMTKIGFKRYRYQDVKNSLRMGDVLVGNTLFDHTETYFGNGLTVGAHRGDLDDKWGDSSGQEISVVPNALYDYGWEFVYRQV